MPVLFTMTKVGKTSLGPNPEEYLLRFKEHASDCVENAYRLDQSARRSKRTGYLSTSLPEDIFSLLDIQTNVLHGFLTATKLLYTPKGCAMLADGLLFILRDLRNTQKRNLPLRLVTLEDACAAANDFFRMSERMEELLNQWTTTYGFLDTSEDDSKAAAVRREGTDLVHMWSCDAVHAAERAQVFVMRAIHKTTIPIDLLSHAWEDDWTHNEVATALVQVFEDYLVDVKTSLAHEFLYHKAIMACVKAAVCFYVTCLIEKADAVGRRIRHRRRHGGRYGRGKPFHSRPRALMRMQDDIAILGNYFEDKVRGRVALERMVAHEIFFLELIHECLGATDAASLETFVLVIHRHSGADTLVTKHFVGDLWLLVADQAGKERIHETFLLVEPDLQMVSKGVREVSLNVSPKSTELSFVSLNEMLRAMYEDRIAQGILPICWPCLPKESTGGAEPTVVARKIRTLTRTIVDMRWKK